MNDCFEGIGYLLATQAFTCNIGINSAIVNEEVCEGRPVCWELYLRVDYLLPSLIFTAES